ncbi:hypothetical protein [Streptomyces decoyicus]|uniref:hypothetical protein n=1 Tax=Streptomyces decoyicus TaxID=249567 RepID=UPI003662E558
MPSPRRRAPLALTTPLLLTATSAGRTALTLAGIALLLLLATTTALALRTAYARNPAHRTAAHRTLRVLLRLAPWYRDHP